MPSQERFPSILVYFFTPRALFFSLSASDLHLRHLVAEIAFLLPQTRHILKNSLLFCAICFFVASVIGIFVKISLFLPDNYSREKRVHC